VLQRFARRFAPVGFKAEAFYPCYGLAESTLFVTGAQRGPGFSPLPRAEAPIAVAEPASSARPLVNCGRAWFEHEVRVVDPETRSAVPPGTTGEIWVRGPSVARGYWNRPEESALCFGARIAGDSTSATYLRTGDLGHMSQGDLFISGRLKDVLIVNGKNRHAEDIEVTVQESDPALSSRRSAAFACERSGIEVAVLVQEVQRPLPEGESEELKKRIQASLLGAYGFTAGDIVFVPSGAIPRTTSGKIRRRDCRRLYETRSLPMFASSHSEHPPESISESISESSR
jgi:acyl-CoA synthetase (AMP-forming)/AMP-acid ligase II